MSVFETAKRHAFWMLGALLVAIVFVAVVEEFVGHSTLAFGVAIIGLVTANGEC